MTTDKPRILLTVDKEFLKRLDTYRYNNWIPTRSEAMRQLLEKALKDYEKNTPDEKPRK